LDFYFDVFLQSVKKVKINNYIKEIERYNDCVNKDGERVEKSFFSEVRRKYPEFNAIFKKSLKEKSEHKIDLIQYLIEHSDFLRKDENEWMKSVMQVVRKTSLFFQPQIRTKIMNEGWASYWHEKLFLQDDRIRGHEVDFARAHAGVTSLQREKFDAETGQGQDFIFKIRENLSDFLFVNTFVDQDFVTRNRLFVAGRRLNKAKMVWEFYVKSRKVEDYRKMLLDTLYHPPYIEIDPEKGKNNTLYLVHRFEGKPLVKEFIANTMMGIEYLWGSPVQLETSEVVSTSPPKEETKEPEIKWQRVLYTIDNRKLSKKNI